MITLRPPDDRELAVLLESLVQVSFSYPEVGATRGDLPAGYYVDRAEEVIGHGRGSFEIARQGIRDWVPFRFPWIRVCSQGPPAKGVLAAVVVRVGPIWWTNVARVIYTIDEPNRFGFAYGTLQNHAEMGEERFLVEYSPDSGDVAYGILAFSRPRHPLVRLGVPLARRIQGKFRESSVSAMRLLLRRANVDEDELRPAEEP